MKKISDFYGERVWPVVVTVIVCAVAIAFGYMELIDHRQDSRMDTAGVITEKILVSQKERIAEGHGPYSGEIAFQAENPDIAEFMNEKRFSVEFGFQDGYQQITVTGPPKLFGRAEVNVLLDDEGNIRGVYCPNDVGKCPSIDV